MVTRKAIILMFFTCCVSKRKACSVLTELCNNDRIQVVRNLLPPRVRFCIGIPLNILDSVRDCAVAL